MQSQLSLLFQKFFFLLTIVQVRDRFTYLLPAAPEEKISEAGWLYPGSRSLSTQYD
ncbi:hypothetical protein QJS04_geneDACA000741 [Acorus gramineus]|uniref:Uncharacterized protein n=1 Tax=Acorus gramineus TaxID=55184 RepID=A0AAV9BKX8_ACOGR|nr:hypothetical protein QJS04_geneDACA000741 [Acorus gramineus]